jgi:hypothetical protein
MFKVAMSELSISSKAERDYLKSIVIREVDPYINLKRRKANGRTRYISMPTAEIARIQKRILRKLEAKVRTSHKDGSRKISGAAHAYVKGRSHATAAEVHLGMTWGVKMDISGFFDNITEEHVRRAFVWAGMRKESVTYATLCTRVSHNWPEELPPKYRRYLRTINQSANSWPISTEHRWFSLLLPGITMPRKVQRMHATKNALARHTFWILPAKRLPRIYPSQNSRKIQVDSFAEMDTQFFFVRLRTLWSWLKKKSNYHEKLTLKNKSRRSQMLEILNDRVAQSVVMDSPRQSYYPVRPGQYRLRKRIGNLPQGASTSGILSNLVMARFDFVVSSFCRKNSLRYTRYSDDIVISSGGSDYSRDRALQVVSFIQKLCEFNGFSLNKQKTRIITPASRKFMLGVMVDGTQLRLGKYDRDRIERAIRKIAKFGYYWEDYAPEIHLLNKTHSLAGKRLGSYSAPFDPSDPLNSLLGWLAYCKRVDLEYLNRIHSNLEANKWAFSDGELRDFLLKFTSTLLNPKTKSKLERQRAFFDWKNLPPS